MFCYPSIYFDDPPQAGRAIDLWVPEKPSKPFAIFFIHGGGWRNGHREQMHQLMYGFFQAGYPCVSVCYRLGEATVATQLSDVREGMALAQKELRDRGLSDSLVLFGESAGGHLALLAGLAAPGACGDSFAGDAPKFSAIIAGSAPITFEPWENIFPVIWRSMQKAAGVPYEQDPELYRVLSPESYLSPASPPLLFLLAECEHMFPNKMTVALCEQWEAKGRLAKYHIYEQAEHGFFYALTRPAQCQAFAHIMAFLNGLPS